MKKFLLLISFFLISACATPQFPLVSVRYDGSPSQKSSKTASFELIEGKTVGGGRYDFIPLGTTSIVTYSGPDSRLNFNKKDQAVFLKSLIDEVERHKLLKVQNENSNMHIVDVEVKIKFKFIHYKPRWNKYKIVL